MDWLINIFKAISGLISEPLRNILKDALIKWDEAAEKTPSQVDDIIVGLIRSILDL